MPTEPEFDAARQFLASKASGSATVSAPPSEHYIVHTDGTYSENPNWAQKPETRSNVSPGEGVYNPATGKYDVPIPPKPAARSNVSPGEGVYNPDTGTYDVPVPAKPAGPGKTQAQIDQEAADAHAKEARDAANTRTPEQKAQLELNNARALEAQRAHDQIEVEKGKLQAQLDAGTLLPADAAAALKEKYEEIRAQSESVIRQAEAQFTHDLAQPNVQAGLDIQKQNADTNAAQVENSRISQQQTAERENRQQQIGVLSAQAAQGQANMDRVVKAGSATPMSAATLRAALNPLQLALQLSRQAVSSGQLQQSAIPTPQAPVPAQATQAAPIVAPRTAPMPAYPTSDRGALDSYPQVTY